MLVVINSGHYILIQWACCTEHLLIICTPSLGMATRHNAIFAPCRIL
jgi:hypothetical protein